MSSVKKLDACVPRGRLRVVATWAGLECLSMFKRGLMDGEQVEYTHFIEAAFSCDMVRMR